MKAEVSQQRSLVELSEVDAELSRLTHRSGHLEESRRHDELSAEQRAAQDRVAVLQIALEDLDGQVARLESEVDGVRQREDRDRSLMASGSVNSKQITELQHELETLERRQASLEDSLLEVMERREELVGQQVAEQAVIDGLSADLDAATQARDAVLAEIEGARADRTRLREQLVKTLDPDLIALYERQRATVGVGAGVLQGRRCGACRIEIDRGELSRIAAADEDALLRCPECGAILLRVKGFTE